MVPLKIHWKNKTEKDIKTMKDHLITGLATVLMKLPLHLWCRIFPLETTTLNLLQPSCMNPHLSAEGILNQNFDHNKNLVVVLPGTKVLVHKQPTNRKMWDPMGPTDGI